MFYHQYHRIIDYLEELVFLGNTFFGYFASRGNLNVLRSAGRSPIQIVLISAAGATLLALPMLLFDILLRKIYLNAESEKNVLRECKYFKNMGKR